MKKKIRQTFTVVREYETTDSLEDIQKRAFWVSDEAGEFLYGDSSSNETISVKIEFDKGEGWEEVNTD
jgi:hypothetical protein